MVINMGMATFNTLHDKPILAESTVAQYTRVYSGFENRIRRQERLGKDTPVNPAKIAMLFNESEGGWESKTARLYRASLMHGFRTKQDCGDEQAKGAIELLTHVHDGEEERLARLDDLRRQRKLLRRLPPRGPRQKVKRFSKADAELLVNALIAMRSPSGPMAAMWFIATALTGLRPCEWPTASIDSHHTMQFALVVKNAKATQGRSHGEKRSIVLSGMDETQNRVIRVHMGNIAREHESGKFDAFYRNCRRCVERTADALWPSRPRHPTIYTARHMFAADIKSVYTKFEVAALMGHASIETAGEHYAQRWSGTGAVGVSPDDLDVQAVMALNKEPANANAWIVDAIPKAKPVKKKIAGDQKT